ncbi:MAG: glycosyltransferase family 9 protein [Vampirovibrionales bacterium]|nr:glycosyltransferase family 9 protein [Vampirovibrionales bacterium]
MLQASNIPQSILIIRLGAMGDLVHAASAIQVLKQAHPELAIDWLTTPFYKPLLEAFRYRHEASGELLPLFRSVFCYDKSENNAWRKALDDIRKRRYDALVNLHPSFKTRLLSFLSGAVKHATYQKQKLSIQGEGQRELPRRHAVSDFLQPVLALYPDLATSINATFLETHWPPVLAVSELDSAKAPSLKKPYIALIIGVGGKRANRGWPLENFEALITLILAKTELAVVLVGGPEEKASAASLEKALRGAVSVETNPRLHNLCDKLSLLETASLLQGASLVLGGDTGPLHLASCFDVPIIALFGPTSIKRTGALGPETKRLHLLPDENLACWPCEQPTCHLPADQHLACMHENAPEAVFKALAAKLSEG